MIRAEYNFAMDRIDVYWRLDQFRCMVYNGKLWEMVERIPPGESHPVAFSVPRYAVHDLIAALQHPGVDRPAATERHLDDAIEVRDRLLSLVEQFSMNRISRG